LDAVAHGGGSLGVQGGQGVLDGDPVGGRADQGLGGACEGDQPNPEGGRELLDEAAGGPLRGDQPGGRDELSWVW
jgi:hypothetical protein